MVRFQVALAGLLLQAAVPAMAAQPDVPAIDYAVPLAVQPFTTDPAVIWYDSFDDPARRSGYLELLDDGGLFGYSSEEALGGRGQSLRGLFRKGTVSAGSLKLVFGDCPLGRAPVRQGEKFTTIYWRVYVKHQRGWTGNPAKMSRGTSLAGTNWSQAMIGHVWQGPGNVLTLDPASGIDAGGKLVTTQYNDFAHLRWLGNQPSAGFPIFATAESGKWVAVEACIRLNTPGQSDGAFTLWIDGRMEAFRDGLNWVGTWQEKGINAVFLENYWNSGSPVEQARYFDDFVVSTTPIGLARTPLNPEIVKTPFESPDAGDRQQGFEVQVASACGGEIVWDSGTISTAGNRVTVDAASGTFRGKLARAAELQPNTRYAVRVRQRNASTWSEWSAWRIVIHTQAVPRKAGAKRR
jgi:hypothetical protein